VLLELHSRFRVTPNNNQADAELTRMKRYIKTCDSTIKKYVGHQLLLHLVFCINLLKGNLNKQTVYYSTWHYRLPEAINITEQATLCSLFRSNLLD